MRRHDIDPLSLVFGLMFTAAGALFLSANLSFGDFSGEWVWPIPLVLGGTVMLISALTRRDDEAEPDELETSEEPSEPAHD